MTKRKVYECTAKHKFLDQICGKKFKFYVNLHNHLHMHSGAKPWKCAHHGCSSAFAAQSNLIDHTRRHTKTMPHMCPVDGCGRKFYRHNVMIRHGKAKAHRDIPEAVFLRMAKRLDDERI